MAALRAHEKCPTVVTWYTEKHAFHTLRTEVIDVMEATAKLEGDTYNIINPLYCLPWMATINTLSWYVVVYQDNVLSKVTKKNNVGWRVDALMLLYKACRCNVKYKDAGNRQEQINARAAHPNALCVPWLRDMEMLPLACDEMKIVPLATAKQSSKNQEEMGFLV